MRRLGLRWPRDHGHPHHRIDSTRFVVYLREWIRGRRAEPEGDDPPLRVRIVIDETFHGVPGSNTDDLRRATLEYAGEDTALGRLLRAAWHGGDIVHLSNDGDTHSDEWILDFLTFRDETRPTKRPRP